MFALYGNGWVWYEPNPVIYWTEVAMTAWGVFVAVWEIADYVKKF